MVFPLWLELGNLQKVGERKLDFYTTLIRSAVWREMKSSLKEAIANTASANGKKLPIIL